MVALNLPNGLAGHGVASPSDAALCVHFAAGGADGYPLEGECPKEIPARCREFLHRRWQTGAASAPQRRYVGALSTERSIPATIALALLAKSLLV